MNDKLHLIEIYCAGAPSAPHARRYVARMARMVRADDATGWAVARDGGRAPRADQSGQGHDRLYLKCGRCPVNAQIVFDEAVETRAHGRMVRALDEVAAAGQRELPLHALAGIV